MCRKSRATDIKIYIYIIWKDGETIESIFPISKKNEVKFSLNRIIHLYIIIIPKIFSIREKIEIDKIEKTF